MSAIFSVKLPYRVRCSLPECGKPVNLVFRETLDGIPSNFCSTPHANEGEKRWNEKKNLDIRLGVPARQTNDFDSGNLPDEGVNQE